MNFSEFTRSWRLHNHVLYPIFFFRPICISNFWNTHGAIQHFDFLYLHPISYGSWWFWFPSYEKSSCIPRTYLLLRVYLFSFLHSNGKLICQKNLKWELQLKNGSFNLMLEHNIWCLLCFRICSWPYWMILTLKWRKMLKTDERIFRYFSSFFLIFSPSVFLSPERNVICDLTWFNYN